MALPVILIDSATGSDTAASGAGPGTALTGTSATTDVAGTLVTLDGAPDLTGVATDGSHVIFLLDSTSGAQNFGKITAKDNGAKTVTVATAFRASILIGESIDWAIGGRRASLGGTTSKKLASNPHATSPGDARPGWIIQCSSAHTETISEVSGLGLDWRRAGDTTDGPITLRGEAGGTRPIITYSGNSIGMRLQVADGFNMQFLDLRNSNATKTASRAIINASSSGVRIRDVRIDNAANNWWKAYDSTGNGDALELCTIANTASDGVTMAPSDGCSMFACWVHHCGGHGILYTSEAAQPMEFIGCIINNNTGRGIFSSAAGASGANRSGLVVLKCAFHANGSHHIEEAGTSARKLSDVEMVNNVFSNSGGYDINFSGAGVTLPLMQFRNTMLRNNDHFGAATGNIFPTALAALIEGNPGLDPQFVSAATGDFRVGTNMQAEGYPDVNIGTVSLTRSYVDIGAAQRIEPANSVQVLLLV